MAYTNSPLATYTRLTNKHSGQRTHSIDRITPHCIVGQTTGRWCVDYFCTSGRDASCNYAIGKDGDIALGVEEKNRSWCTSSNANDQRAVTIECASDTTHPYAFTNACYQALIKLCVDICKRNGKTKLLWLADKNTSLNYEPKSNEMVLTAHRWFVNKACPGDWLYNREADLAAKVTAQLGGSASVTPTQPNVNFPSVPFLVQVIIDDLNIRTSAGMGDNLTGKYTGKGVFTIVQVSNGWGKLKSGAGWIYLENPSYVTIGKHVETSTPAPSTPSVPDAPVTVGTNNEETIWNYLIKHIVNPYGVAGLMGNLYAESALRPENLQNTFEKSLGLTDAQYTAQVDAGTYSKDKFIHDKAGYGLAQWTYWSRKEAMYNAIKGKGKSIGDLQAQLEFLASEIAGYKTVYGTLKNATSVRQASDAVLTGYERPADQSEAVQAKRASYGQVYYDKYAEKEKAPSDAVVALSQRDAYVKKAQEWVGLKESDNSFKKVIDTYNKGLADAVKHWGTRNVKMDYSWHWCSCFASAVAMAAGVADIVPIEISCYYHIEIAKKNGIWIENDAYVPKKGDLILYDWDDSGAGDNTGSPDHIGIVESCDGKNIVVIEGNMGGTTVNGEYLGTVGRRTIAVNGRYIRGFITPKFGDDNSAPAPSASETTQWYRVRKSWDDPKSQVGAYKVYNNAIKKADEMGHEYAVYNWNGKEMYRPVGAVEVPFLVRVSIDDLNIRRGAGTNYNRTGQYTGKGVFTIVEVANGEGSETGWGRLKSGAGWISLDYCERV